MFKFIGKKKGDEGVGGEEPLRLEPEKARAWFDRARTAADTRNYEYAMTCYLTGLKFDPSNMQAHEDLFNVAAVYRSSGGSAASNKEVRSVLGDKRPVDRLVAAELAWVKDVANPNYALEFTKLAADLGLNEVAYWVAQKGALAAARLKKPNKNLMVKFMDLFEQIGAYDKAVECGDAAVKIDNSDAQLLARVRNLSAQATMSRGRYDSGVNEEGGYRGSIKDADAQRALIEDESITGGEDVEARRIARTKAEWEENPTAPDAIQKYGDALRKTEKPEFEKEAIRVYLDGFKSTGQYRFRVAAGDIKLTMERRKLREMRERAEASGDPAEAEAVAAAERKLLEKEAVEFAERVEQYPTDLRLRFELGRRYYDLGRFEDAIPLFQEAQGDARNRAASLHYIGLCFLEQEWHEEAIQSLRAAVEAWELKDDETHLNMRYDLMLALEAFARENEELEAAEEANKLASGIALKQLNFRDIRERRDALRTLVKELKGK